MTNDKPTKNEMLHEKYSNIDCCTIGSQPRDISEAKVGDWVTVTTKEGKSWRLDVVSKTGDVIYLQNKHVRLVLDVKAGRLCNIYEQDDFDIRLENIPRSMINEDVIEFQNYKEDDKTIHILQLVGLHLPKMTEEQKDQLIEDFWNIHSPGKPRLKKVK